MVFPKVAISDKSGILIAEIILIFISISLIPTICSRLAQKNTINKVVATFLFFLIFYILFGSLVSGAQEGIFPTKASLQALRVTLYASLILLANASFSKNITDDNYYQVLKWGFMTELLIAGLYFCWAYLVVSPSVGEMLGSYFPGSRMIPMYGLAFGTGGDMPLEVVGGGSGNLLGSHALFICILASFFERKTHWEITLICVSILVMACAQSRGGAFTICIWGMYRIWCLAKTRKQFKLSSIFTISFIVSIVGLAFFYLLEYFPFFARIESVMESGELDSSSSARLINYEEVLAAWIRDPLAIFIGLGFDENVLELRSGWTLVESLVLSVLFCGGLISFTLLITFYFQVFNRKKLNVWWNALFLFLIFELFINWSVTGGDLIGPPALFAIFLMLGLAIRDQRTGVRSAIQCR